jgi:hypothetical protein
MLRVIGASPRAFLLPFTLREGFMTYARLLANNNLPN